MTNEQKFGAGTDAMHAAFQQVCDCCLAFCCDYKQMLRCQLEWLDAEYKQDDDDDNDGTT